MNVTPILSLVFYFSLLSLIFLLLSMISTSRSSFSSSYLIYYLQYLISDCFPSYFNILVFFPYNLATLLFYNHQIAPATLFLLNNPSAKDDFASLNFFHPSLIS